MSLDVFHPGREIQAESQKGHRSTDYVCQYEDRCRSLWNHPNHGHPALCNRYWQVVGHHMKSTWPLPLQFWCEHVLHSQGRERSPDIVPQGHQHSDYHPVEPSTLCNPVEERSHKHTEAVGDKEHPVGHHQRSLVLLESKYVGFCT